MEEPVNPALDALFLRAAKHAEVRMEFCAALLEAELLTLVPRGQSTRAADSVARPEGRNIPLIGWKQEGKEYYFLYTSARMARKGLKYFSGLGRQPMVIIAMPGERLLRMMAQPGTWISLNPGTETFELSLNDKIVAGMLDGTFFEGEAEGPEGDFEAATVALRPEEYPMELVQPVFDHLKTRPDALAAWILRAKDPGGDGKVCYVFALLSGADDARSLEQSVGMVLSMVNGADRKDVEFGITSFDYGSPEEMAVMRNFVPFFAAPGYKVPAV